MTNIRNQVFLVVASLVAVGAYSQAGRPPQGPLTCRRHRNASSLLCQYGNSLSVPVRLTRSLRVLGFSYTLLYGH